MSMTKLSFCYTQALQCFPVSCLKSVSQRDTAVSSQKRPKSVLDTDNPYHVACLAEGGFIEDLMDWLQHSVGSLVLKIDGTHQVNNMIPIEK